MPDMLSDFPIGEWLAPGFDFTFEYPTKDRPTFRASIEEFGISAEADTLDEAYNAALDDMVQMIVERLRRGEALPPRHVS